MYLPARSRPSDHRRVIALLLGALTAAPIAAGVSAQTGGRVDVRVVADEAEAAIAILGRQERGQAVAPDDWRRLFESEGYRALKKRETAMGRAFTDSSFEAFLRSDTLRRRTGALATAVPLYRQLDANGAGRQALAYLPAGARIRALMYPMIKPITNSFVFTPDSVMAIFMYMDPKVTADQLRNTLTHELHHVGYGTACPMSGDSTVDARARLVIERAFAFGEGLAMLAAAGSADVHPHAWSEPGARARWDRDVANFPADLARLQSYFLDVLDGRIASPDSVRRVAMTFYGEQGPWYTVGWVMASTIEKAFGRDRLIAAMCDPRQLMAVYNQAALRGGRKDAVWSDDLLRRLGPVRR